MKRTSWFIAGGLLVSLLLAGVLSNFASASPDGLESALHEGCVLAEDGTIVGGDCVARRAGEHELAGPFADYSVTGVESPFLGTAVAGGVGVLLTFAVGGGLFWLVRRPSRRTPAGPAGQPES
ncbi:PDGLE domain-containing protein [Pilimelia columellifera]|uniref:PDGLE domain-containing protein n=1 Tax=Pilimelia columellifera subsp. columellifera TaxID=706583 RepID=A0ABN3NIS4_9ACTN